MIEQNGAFDILVNAAGMARHGAALDTDPQDFDAVTQVNLRAAYFALREVAKGLMTAGRAGIADDDIQPNGAYWRTRPLGLLRDQTRGGGYDKGYGD